MSRIPELNSPQKDCLKIVGLSYSPGRHKYGFGELRQVRIDSTLVVLPRPLICTGHELKFQVDRKGTQGPPPKAQSTYLTFKVQQLMEVAYEFDITIQLIYNS